MTLHARSLRYFDEIRRSGSIREAARRLHVASSAVNRQLLQLEQQLGTPLFDRLPAGLKLTAAGELFSRHVITVLQDEQRMNHELDLLRGIRRGEVKLVSVEGLNAEFLPAVLQRMLERYPLIRIGARSAGSAHTAQAVIDGDADVALGFSVERHEALRQCVVGRFALGAIVRPDHPLAGRGQVSFTECTRYPLILPGPELSIHAAMRPLLANHRRSITVPLTSGTVELARVLAMRGAGIAFQTRVGIERDLAERRLAFVPLKAAVPLVSELGAYVRAGRTLPPAVDAFVQIVADELQRREAQERTAGR
ncbi:MAG TPA: LysR substrate-binding domain-containing protein [Burkholderiaceae bacterium]|nr:LysR substrate-binding domain-containing protein [Burkholderiaceae bacterium]